ncbi:unnamed protein product, partial [Strongylus vulgaris]
GFGAVYLCKNKEGELNALKIEAENDPLGLLKMEVYVLMELKKTKFQARHFLGLKDRGHVPGKFNYVVMTLELRNEASMKKFSMGTAISVGRQCLEALEDLHNVGILHRDIKPGNYTIGRKEMNELRKESNDVGLFKKDCKGERYRCLFGGCPREYTEIFPILDKVRSRGNVPYIFPTCSIGPTNLF